MRLMHTDCTPPVRLSITHKFSSDHGTRRYVGGGQREGLRRVWSRTVEHRHPEDTPTQNAKERDQMGQTRGGPKLRILSFAA